MSSEYPSGRTAKGYAIILGAARAASLAAHTLARNSVAQIGERDEFIFLVLNDPIPAAAILNARASLPGFLALAKRPAPAMDGFAVKIALLGVGGPAFFWIHPFARVDDQFIGKIANAPHSLEGLKTGTTITFTKGDIVDWMYMDAGRMVGNYSARAVLLSELPQDRKSSPPRFGLDPDF